MHIRGLRFITSEWGVIQGRCPRCEKDIRAVHIKKIVSQDHSGDKETGQPSPRDWMSPHLLGL